MTPELEWFFNCIDIKGPDDCWPWISDKTPTGYGSFRVGRLSVTAHRKMWTLIHGDIPKFINNRKTLIRHICGNRCCVNPNHLLLGNYSDNARDAHREGKRLKFSKEDVLKIRYYRGIEKQTFREIGKIFNMPQQSIIKVYRGIGIYSEM